MISTSSLYSHFTKPHIDSGLICKDSKFLLNGNEITIYSGALHYFRVPRLYWRDRIRKMKAAGLNTVETYIPWNLHEETPGKFDFGKGGTLFEDFLDVKHFLQLAQDEDMLVIVRPGPYICSEWDFGGLPSWLLKDPTIEIRRNDPKFLQLVERYFVALFKVLSNLQFTKGGPIIAFQVENEYGNVAVKDQPIDAAYLDSLVAIFKRNEIVELLFTSDTPSNGNQGAIPGILYTANFQTDATKELTILQRYQPGMPSMVMEFWTGWFDHWGEKHHEIPDEQFEQELEAILKFPSSVNFYMFHGGTNWGFMNGANIMSDKSVAFDTSSYDYDAPLTEYGDYTSKYHIIKRLISQNNQFKIENLGIPMPDEIPRVKYPDISSCKMIKIQEIIENTTACQVVQNGLSSLTTMEGIDQLYGYTAYTTTLTTVKPGASLKLCGKVKDTILVLVNGVLINKPFEKPEDLNGFGYWKAENASIVLSDKELMNANLTLVIENFGRVNYGKLYQFNQYRGLDNKIFLDEQEILEWSVKSIDLKQPISKLIECKPSNIYNGPAIYEYNLIIDINPLENFQDSFLDMSLWNKGLVIVNDFPLSRYFKLGPQQTCYLPGPLLKKGINKIRVFEHFQNAAILQFNDMPKFHTIQ